MGGLNGNTKMLLHLDGADTSTTFTDETGTHTPSAVADAQLDTAQKKWGTASLLLDGTGDYVTVAAHADFDLVGSATSNWTIDFQFRCNTHTGSDHIISQQEDAQNFWRLLHDDQGGGTDGLRFEYTIGGVNKIDMGGGEVADSNWHHGALIKVGQLFGTYVDGTQVAYGTTADTDDLTASGIQIGAYGGANLFDGWIDELRIQNGNPFAALPNATPDDTITVPTAAYSRSVGVQAVTIG